MSLANVSDFNTEFLVRNNRTTTDSFITDTMLGDWVRQANSYCSARYPWPFTEGRDQTLSWSGTEEIDYSSFNLDYRTDGIRWLEIGGKKLKKLDFESYKQFKEDQPDADDRVFTDFNRVIFINTLADVSGTIVAYGQYVPSIDTTDLTATTVFSTYDQEGNEAIIEKMTSYLKRREHLPDEAELHDQRCQAKLDGVWSRIGEEQFRYQQQRGSEGMWKRINIIGGDYDDALFNRDQF